MDLVWTDANPNPESAQHDRYTLYAQGAGRQDVPRRPADRPRPAAWPDVSAETLSMATRDRRLRMTTGHDPGPVPGKTSRDVPTRPKTSRVVSTANASATSAASSSRGAKCR